MATEDVLSKVKGDPVLAERLRCGGCQRALNQVEDYTLVEIPGKKRSAETGAAKGFLCSQCQKDAARSKEGPRQAVYVDSFGDVRIDFYDNLVDSGSATGTTTTTTTTTGQPAEEKAVKTKASGVK